MGKSIDVMECALLGKSIDVMECVLLELLYNKQLNVSLIDLVWENSIYASVTFGTHTYNTVCVCVTYITWTSMLNHIVYCLS